MNFHALGRSGCLAGMCYADLRDQPSSFIRMYITDVFGHPRTSLKLVPFVAPTEACNGILLARVSHIGRQAETEVAAEKGGRVGWESFFKFGTLSIPSPGRGELDRSSSGQKIENGSVKWY